MERREGDFSYEEHAVAEPGHDPLAPARVHGRRELEEDVEQGVAGLARVDVGPPVVGLVAEEAPSDHVDAPLLGDDAQDAQAHAEVEEARHVRQSRVDPVRAFRPGHEKVLGHLRPHVRVDAAAQEVAVELPEKAPGVEDEELAPDRAQDPDLPRVGGLGDLQRGEGPPRPVVDGPVVGRAGEGREEEQEAEEVAGVGERRGREEELAREEHGEEGRRHGEGDARGAERAELDAAKMVRGGRLVRRRRVGLEPRQQRVAERAVDARRVRAGQVERAVRAHARELERGPEVEDDPEQRQARAARRGDLFRVLPRVPRAVEDRRGPHAAWAVLPLRVLGRKGHRHRFEGGYTERSLERASSPPLAQRSLTSTTSEMRRTLTNAHGDGAAVDRLHRSTPSRCKASTGR